MLAKAADMVHFCIGAERLLGLSAFEIALVALDAAAHARNERLNGVLKDLCIEWFISFDTI